MRTKVEVAKLRCPRANEHITTASSIFIDGMILTDVPFSLVNGAYIVELVQCAIRDARLTLNRPNHLEVYGCIRPKLNIHPREMARLLNTSIHILDISLKYKKSKKIHIIDKSRN